MDIAIHGARTQAAHERILAAAAVLAERFAVADPAAALRDARHADPAIATLFQREATADLLEALVAATAPDMSTDMSEPVKRGRKG